MPERQPHTRRTMAFVAGTLILLGVLLAIQFLNAPPVISAREARELLERDSTAVLLDVRNPEEFHGPLGHLRGAILIPLDSLERESARLEAVRGRTIVVYCRSGRRSMNATAFLRQRGFDALNLEGGILSWREFTYPVEGARP